MELGRSYALRSEADEKLGTTEEASTKKQLGLKIFKPAGFFRRALAHTLDLGLIVLLVSFFTVAGLMGLQGGIFLGMALPGRLESILPLAFIFIYLGYFSFFHSSAGQTPGKMVLRICVVSDEGEGISDGHALLRSLIHCFSYLFMGIGFLMSLFGEKKKTLHDRITGTQVVLCD